ncbi:Galactinol synthase 2 [Rhypophila sp. PSN 637]
MSPHAQASSQPPKNGTIDTRDSKAWATLLTKSSFLQGVLTLHYSLIRTKTQFPFIVLYPEGVSPDDLPPSCIESLHARGIQTIQVPYLLPKASKDFQDKSFHESWTKFTAFGLTQYSRLVLLDADMLVVRNMDELMDEHVVGLDPISLEGTGNRVFAACHACTCNPAKKAHYPKDWVPQNCAYTTQHSNPTLAQTAGAPPNASPSRMPNGGLLVINPSEATYKILLSALEDPKTGTYDFADQELLGDIFGSRWVTLPYIYNALKPMRWSGVHDAIWRDENVKNVHYIMSPKPWMGERPSAMSTNGGAETPSESSDSGEDSGKDFDRYSTEDVKVTIAKKKHWHGKGDETDKNATVLMWWWRINDERERVE